MNRPLISVIIPTYNRASPLMEAVRSVLEQTYKTIELLVVDDGSEDETPGQLKKIEDTRLRVLVTQHGGVSRARNRGVAESKGEWIAFLDSDDRWKENKLETQLVFHSQNPHLQISQTSEIWIRNGKRVNPARKHLKPAGYIFPESLHLCTITPSSVLMKKSLFESTGGFDEALPSCEDYDLWLRITAEHSVGLVDKLLLVRYGGHSDQLSAKFPAMDRFRLFSMGNLLNSGTLNAKQTDQLLAVFDQKTAVLLNGYEKRGKESTELKRFLDLTRTGMLSAEEFRNQGIHLLISEHFD